ncbi:MAG: LLM class F420-dependent oxidoreductase [Pseudomonadales bacterium]
MKFGLIPVNVGTKSAEQVVGLAQLAEAAGMESVWTFEHVMVPRNYNSKYPYHKSGKMGIEPEANFIDPLIALTTVAAHTKTLRLGTGVNILPQCNPLLLAKQAASLDLMSNGRFMLGVGIGWLREEYEAMGVPFERRGARYDDYLRAMKKVWSGAEVEHESEFLHWHGFHSFPIPAQKPHLPIIIGGASGKVFERVALYGDGWYAPVDNADDLVPPLQKLKAACNVHERDYNSIELTAMFNPGDGLDGVQRYQDLGVQRLTVPLHSLGEDPIKGISELGEQVIAKL